MNLNQYINNNIGIVTKIMDDIVIAKGLENAGYCEMVKFQYNISGIVCSIKKNSICIMLLDNNDLIKTGDFIRRQYKYFSIQVGNNLIGRILNSKGDIIDNKKLKILKKSFVSSVDDKEVGVIQRRPIYHPVYTGIKTIDNLFPIGRGQRELIIGDRKTGKTSICIDTILNQRHKNTYINRKKIMYCIYVSIGQKQSSNAKVIKKLIKFNALRYTTIIVSSCSDSITQQFYAPYAGCTLAEYFRDRSMHSLVVYDDLTKHAMAYRSISLLLRKPPGREAYPGDIFYSHSRLLERSCQLSDTRGKGSMTALPIIETQDGDLSSYIPTNVVSITDGQIFLESELFYKNIKPAINIGLSVSRIGSAAQIIAVKNISSILKNILIQYEDIKSFCRFNIDMDKHTSDIINKGKIASEVLKQGISKCYSIEKQMLVFFMSVNNIIKDLNIGRIVEFEAFFIYKTELENYDLLNYMLLKYFFYSNIEYYIKRYARTILKDFLVV